MNSVKSLIRETILALSRGDTEAASNAISEAITEKTAQLIEGGDAGNRAAKRFARMGRKVKQSKHSALKAPTNIKEGAEKWIEALATHMVSKHSNARDGWNAAIKEGKKRLGSDFNIQQFRQIFKRVILDLQNDDESQVA